MATDAVAGTREGTPARVLKAAAAFILAYVACCVGRALGPVIYPYKLYLSESPQWTDRVLVQFRALRTIEYHTGQGVAESLILLIPVFAIAYGLIRIRRMYSFLFYYVVLGLTIT